MPAADATDLDPLGDTTVTAPVPTSIRGWGGGKGVTALVLRPYGVDGVRAAVALCRSPGRNDGAPPGTIARGRGRSYGDAAQLSGGHVLDMTSLRGFDIDENQATVTTQAGVTIGELLGALVPAGWMLPVVPGTQHVTVGGAIASDIHGKNHGTAGTFGSHVRALGLLTAEGQELELKPSSDDGLFEATLGGMGLTGVLLWARIGLRRIGSSLLSVDTDRVQSLDDALDLLSGGGGPHRVAWLDLLGPRAGRGIITRADHLEGAASLIAAGRRDGPTVRARASVPKHWPAGMLRASTVRAFNELRFRLAPRRERGRPEALGVHMFPLDSLAAWPRLYGKQGLLQYQLVVPSGQEQVLNAVIERLRRGRVPCFLAVLKDLGAANDSPLSFPLAGWTLALDLPRAAPGIGLVLDDCDELVAEAGGRVYLTKDARLRPSAVSAMYPRLQEWRIVRDRADPEHLWRSDLALRTGLVDAAR
jgi:decaprenylphospho-beta-D-ribofuranose 2-oxidase